MKIHQLDPFIRSDYQLNPNYQIEYTETNPCRGSLWCKTMLRMVFEHTVAAL